MINFTLVFSDIYILLYLLGLVQHYIPKIGVWIALIFVLIISTIQPNSLNKVYEVLT